MDYYIIADLLNKFHTSLPWIQLVWLISIPAMIFGIAWCIKESTRAIFTAFGNLKNQTPPASLSHPMINNIIPENIPEDSDLVYRIYRTKENELLMYRGGNIVPLDRESQMVLLLADGVQDPTEI